MAKPLVNITIVTHNRLPLTRMCLETLLQHTKGDYVVHVVDNASNDGTQDYLCHLARQDSRIICIFLDSNRGVSVAANLAWAAINTPYYVKLDNDMLILKPDWLDLLLGMSQRNPEIGMVGYQCCGWHKTEQLMLASGDIFIDSDCCGGACVLIPRTIHERFGFWNEDYGIYGFEDLDYGGRVLCGGLSIGYVPDMDRVEHRGYDPMYMNGHMEYLKRSNIESEKKGKKLYVLNKFMFEKGIRPLYVLRKYLPKVSTKQNEVRPDHIVKRLLFSNNPDYAAIVRLQAKYLPFISFNESPEGITIKFEQNLADFV